jgi:hypothetical protein
MGRGGDIAILGLFRSHYGKNRNIPIVRAGHIAALPEEPVNTRHGYMEAYLVEAQSIAGLSGSPLLAMGDAGIEALHLALGDKPKDLLIGTRLLGLVQGHFDVPNLNEDVVADSDAPAQSIHTGIGVVVPTSKILETLDHPDLVKVRQDMIDEDRKSGATPDLFDENDELG